MDYEKFDRWVARLNGVAERRPALYRLSVASFTVFGFAVYLLVLLSALALVGGMAAFAVMKPSFWIIKFGWKLGIPIGVLAWVMLKSLKVTLPPPQGLPVEREQAPELFVVLDRVSERLKVPRLERVLLTHEYNASVVQLPRYGLFGTTSYLMLGVPLLQALSKDDVTSVLAHELGHLSGNHSRFSGWIYRTVRSYEQVLESVGDNKLLHKFLNWYVPRLEALSFPLRRQNEYEADAASAEIVGARRAVQALANVHVRGALESSFWGTVKRSVRDTPHPPAQVFWNWEKELAKEAPADGRRALEEALRETTANTDTHPSLADRVKKLGATPMFEAMPDASAARALLGSSHNYFVEQAGLRWSAQVHEGWQGEHQRLLQASARVATLEAERAARPLTVDESFELADLREDLHPDDDPLPLYRSVLESEPTHLGARFAIGRLLLARNDQSGAELMAPLTKHPEPVLRLQASALLAAFYARRGEHDAVAEHMAAARAAHEKRVERQRAQEQLLVTDRFEPHDLDAEALRHVREELAAFPGISRAYLVRKVLDGETLAFVLALELSVKQRLKRDDTLTQRVVETLNLPAPAWCIRLDGNEAFRSRLKKVANSRLDLA